MSPFISYSMHIAHRFRRLRLHPFATLVVSTYTNTRSIICIVLSFSLCASANGLYSVHLMQWRSINFAINYAPDNIQNEFESHPHPLSINRKMFQSIDHTVRCDNNGKGKEIVMAQDDRIPVGTYVRMYLALHIHLQHLYVRNK